MRLVLESFAKILIVNFNLLSGVSVEKKENSGLNFQTISILPG